MLILRMCVFSVRSYHESLVVNLMSKLLAFYALIFKNAIKINAAERRRSNMLVESYLLTVKYKLLNIRQTQLIYLYKNSKYIYCL